MHIKGELNMKDNQILNQLQNLLLDLGLDSLPGSLIYSSIETLNKRDIYLMGSSPGGDPNLEKNTILEHLKFMKNHPSFNEYCDGRWKPMGKVMDSGTSPLQKRVQFLLASLVVNPRNAFATNLIFARFKSENHISDFDLLAKKCWVVHSFLLTKVCPKLIIVLGNKSFDFVSKKIVSVSKIDQFETGHGQGWSCKYLEGILHGRKTGLIMLPHLSRFAINKIKYQPVMQWIKSHVNEGKNFNLLEG